jgi:hypothetical protein
VQKAPPLPWSKPVNYQEMTAQLTHCSHSLALASPNAAPHTDCVTLPKNFCWVTAIHPSIQLWLLGSSPPSVGCINNWSFQVSRCRPSHTVLSLYTVTWGFKKWSVEKPNTKQKQTKWPNNSMDKTKPMTSISSPCGHCFNISFHLQYPRSTSWNRTSLLSAAPMQSTTTQLALSKASIPLLLSPTCLARALLTWRSLSLPTRDASHQWDFTPVTIL